MPLVVTHKARFFGDKDGKLSLGPGASLPLIYVGAMTTADALDRRSQDRSFRRSRKRPAARQKSVRLTLSFAQLGVSLTARRILAVGKPSHAFFQLALDSLASHGLENSQIGMVRPSRPSRTLLTALD